MELRAWAAEHGVPELAARPDELDAPLLDPREPRDWTPEYLEAKARKVEAARLDNLVLVVYRRLAVGGKAEAAGAASVDDALEGQSAPKCG